MGKQINYFMDYETFRTIAEKALELGAVIIRREEFSERQSRDISIVIPEIQRYKFFFPEHADGPEDDKATIEAGYSRIQGRTILPERMYIVSGRYDYSGNWVPRPKEMDQIYSALVRLAKKQMLYKICKGRDRKDYITPAFDELVETKHHVLRDRL